MHVTDSLIHNMINIPAILNFTYTLIRIAYPRIRKRLLLAIQVTVNLLLHDVFW